MRLIAAVQHIDGPLFRGSSQASLLIEVPHGATLTEHFMNYRQVLKSSLPADLIDFFYVNTDVAAPECAEEIAKAYTQIYPDRRVTIVRCHIPRTFIDCNRRLDARQDDIAAGKVTTGLPSYITSEEDKIFLRRQYQRYHLTVQREITKVCARGGYTLFLHSYAPKTVGITEVDSDIVNKLHWAYSKEVYERWPLRPEVDVICKNLEGDILVDADWLSVMHNALTGLGYQVGSGESYPLHPVTMAHWYWSLFPKQVQCLELRRDLLVEEFLPFEEMKPNRSKMVVLAQAIAETIPS